MRQLLVPSLCFARFHDTNCIVISVTVVDILSIMKSATADIGNKNYIKKYN